MSSLIKADLNKLSNEDLLKRSDKYVFSTGLDDGAAKLASINTKYGLAKIHFVQQSFGFSPNACFISTPDQTITRNDYRWDWGSGYGGKYVWGNGLDEIIFPDLKPNSCGMIVVGLESEPSQEQIINNVIALRNSQDYINDIKIKWDFEKSNHFIDVFKKSSIDPYADSSEIKNFDYFGIIHCSAPEMKKVSPGMYIDDSKELYNMCEHVKTPFGNCNVLLDDKAVSYFDFCQRANDFSKQRRVLAANKIFGANTVISNANHQGIISNINEMYLGAHNSLEDCLLPITFKADSIAYLAKGLPNFSEEQIENNGWTKRAENRELINVLLNANVMPHGGGYALNDMLNVEKVITLNDNRYFVCNLEHTEASITISNPKDLQFHYRGKQVGKKSFDLRLAERVAVLEPLFVIKF
ncbi:MAG: hypothetical protein WC307_04520 [Candidatus Nanoarchaeia archaeon]|jgi:hypothetical protein